MIVRDSQRHDAHTLAALLLIAAHLALGLLYSLVTPPWEAHDEWAHFRYAEFVAQERRLPPPGERLTTAYRYDEASQPPLYYILTALPLQAILFDTHAPVSNPFAEVSVGVNFAVHDPAIESFPWRGRILSLHLARWFSLLLSTLGPWPVFALTRWLFPAQPSVALGALASFALSPQALFMGSTVTNDGLVTALGALALWQGMRVVLDPWQLRRVTLLDARGCQARGNDKTPGDAHSFVLGLYNPAGGMRLTAAGSARTAPGGRIPSAQVELPGWQRQFLPGVRR